MDTITLRGEHLINLYRYDHERDYRLMFGETQGYTEEFARRHDDLMQRLLDHPDLPVKVVMGCDDLCLKAPCPRHTEACEAIELLAKDRATADAFGVVLDTTYSAGDLVSQLRRMPPEKAPR